MKKTIHWFLAVLPAVVITGCGEKRETDGPQTERATPEAPIEQEFAVPADPKQSAVEVDVEGEETTATAASAAETTASTPDTTTTAAISTGSLQLAASPLGAIDQTEQAVDQMIVATTAPLTTDQVAVINSYLENVITTSRQAPNVEERERIYMEDVARDAMKSLDLARQSPDVSSREIHLRSIKGSLDQIRLNLAGDKEKD